jgi:predicted nucleotidyltransferase
MREICRNLNLGAPSVLNHLKELQKEDFIIREKKGIYPTYRANRDNEKFKLYKKLNTVLRINETGLLNYIYDNCLPEAIILFGSAALGEDIEESDIDIFIVSKNKNLNLEKYNKILKRKVNLFFEDNFSRLSKELKNNIINGVVLKGYLKVY